MASTTAPPLPSYQSGTAVTAEEYERIALADPSVKWELHDGRLREKPAMSVEHNWLMFYLGHLLQLQLDINEFRIRIDAPYVRWSAKHYYLPDVAVVPVALDLPLRGRPGKLELYDAPLPLVVKVWSLSTGAYDVTGKLAEYQRCGDREIWRLHPYDRTLTAWRRQGDGTYVETRYGGGTVQPVALPNVTIDLDALFASISAAP